VTAKNNMPNPLFQTLYIEPVTRSLLQWVNSVQVAHKNTYSLMNLVIWQAYFPRTQWNTWPELCSPPVDIAVTKKYLIRCSIHTWSRRRWQVLALVTNQRRSRLYKTTHNHRQRGGCQQPILVWMDLTSFSTKDRSQFKVDICHV
jgi:hypothetical protein